MNLPTVIQEDILPFCWGKKLIVTNSPANGKPESITGFGENEINSQVNFSYENDKIQEAHITSKRFYLVYDHEKTFSRGRAHFSYRWGDHGRIAESKGSMLLFNANKNNPEGYEMYRKFDYDTSGLLISVKQGDDVIYSQEQSADRVCEQAGAMITESYYQDGRLRTLIEGFIDDNKIKRVVLKLDYEYVNGLVGRVLQTDSNGFWLRELHYYDPPPESISINDCIQRNYWAELDGKLFLKTRLHLHMPPVKSSIDVRLNSEKENLIWMGERLPDVEFYNFKPEMRSADIIIRSSGCTYIQQRCLYDENWHLKKIFNNPNAYVLGIARDGIQPVQQDRYMKTQWPREEG